VHDDDWFSFAELADRLGSLVWVEQQLSALLMSWSRVEAEPSAAIAFFTAARHHNWHSEVMAGCLPTSPQLRETELVTAPTPGWEDAMALLSDQQQPTATTMRLGALTKVIHPWLERETSALVSLARPISDAAIMRWLRFIELDHSDDGDSLALLCASVESTTIQLEDRVLLTQLDLARL